MPFLTALSRTRRAFPRRAVLRAGAVAALVGPGVAACSAASNKRPENTPSPTRTGPDPQLADLTAETQLLARYDATIAAHPALRTRLRPLRSDHAVHAAKLHALVGGKGQVAAVRPRIPADPAAALQQLRAAEQTAAAERTRSCIAAAVDRCGLLGSIAASEATHAELLA